MTTGRSAVSFSCAYEVDPDHAAGVGIVGTPEEAAERLAAYVEAGVDRIVLSGGSAAGWRTGGGRLAPAKTGTFTSEYALPKADGLDIVFTMTRMDENMSILAEDPHWTGSIK
ncbi:hypothetical protein AB0R12_21010 [Streptomyces niveus]|uniref:hypothetical protein n=1 Tax=Streptomyces niveus TaxID=193462 RepID=UPI0034289A76